VFDGRPDEGENGFDADVALSTGELQKLLPELVEALGGEMAFGAAPTGDAPVVTRPATVTTDGDEGPPF